MKNSFGSLLDAALLNGNFLTKGSPNGNRSYSYETRKIPSIPAAFLGNQSIFGGPKEARLASLLWMRGFCVNTVNTASRMVKWIKKDSSLRQDY